MIDAPGVGRPIVDQLRAAGLDPIAVTITAGKRATRRGGMWYLPKRELVGVLVAAIEHDRLQIASGLRNAAALVGELQAFRAPGHRRRQGRLRGGNGRARRSGGGFGAGGVVGGAPDPD